MLIRQICVIVWSMSVAISPLQAMFRAPRPPKVKAPKVRKLSTKTPKAPTVPVMNVSVAAIISDSEMMPEISGVSATVPMIEVQEVPEVSIVTPVKTKQAPVFASTKSSPKANPSWWERIKAYLIPKRSRFSFDINKIFKGQSPFAWKVKELIEKSSAREAVANMQRFVTHTEGTQRYPTPPQVPLNPNATEKEAIEIVVKAAEQDIKKAHEQQNLPFVEKGLMVCTPPGINAALLLEFDSIEKIQAVFKEKYRLLDLEYKKIENMDDAAFKEYVAKKERDRNYLSNTYYKQPHTNHSRLNATISHRKYAHLPEFVFEETKRILRLVGINPLSVNILFWHENGNWSGGARGPSLSIENGVMDVEKPALIVYNMKILEQLDHQAIIFVIAHEIGHLLCAHNYSIQEYPQVMKENEWDIQEKEKLESRQLKHKIKLLNELEADVTVACLNKEVAQVIHEYLLRLLAKPHADKRFATNVMLSDIHQSFNERYLWIQMINELHKKRIQKPIP